MTERETEATEGPRWAPVPMVAQAALVSCPVCAAVVPDDPPSVERHEEWHAALRRLATP